MPLNIRSEDVNQLAQRLAARKHVTKTEAVRLALREALDRADPEPSFAEKIRAIQDRVAARPSTGLEADKAFYDSLSGEE